MFVLSTIKDTIKILPHDFDVDVPVALMRAIGKKYQNKVLPGVGLVIAPHTILSTTEGIVYYGDGCLYYKVKFTLAIFQPFEGETLVANVQSSSTKGIRLTCTFFNDIYIPSSSFPPHSAYDPDLGLHFWAPSAEEGDRDPLSTDPSERLYLDKGDAIRFRVSTVEYDESAVVGNLPEAELEKRGKAVMKVFGTIADQGLGNLEWWVNVEAMEE
ncbi:hypothetical protein BT69DRAFT_1235039 [Atractiella rhizophila]|nr:hypothetical protein BT69DRAFT_1235039 [Atractiella rhizophila]